MGGLIVDTDVLIDMLRGHRSAMKFLDEKQPEIGLSVVTISELLAGFGTPTEEMLILETISYLRKIPVTEELAIRAGYLRHRYGKSHGTGVIDCIVAATAEAEDATLVTLNRKHYPMLRNLKIPYEK